MAKIKDARKKVLREKFNEAVNQYLLALLEMWEWDAHYGYWIADNIGGIYAYGENYFIGFDDMRYIVDNNVKKEVYYEWSEYCLVANEYNFSIPNLDSWIKGCPRVSQRDIEYLQGLKSKLIKECERLKEKF